MHKALIRLRKKTLLPIKWAFSKWNKERNLEVRDKKDVLEKIDELDKHMTEISRTDKDISSVYAQIRILNWVLYDKKK